MYRVSDWAADWARKEQLVESITAYPTASRVSSAKRTHTKAATSSNKVTELLHACDLKGAWSEIVQKEIGALKSVSITLVLYLNLLPCQNAGWGHFTF